MIELVLPYPISANRYWATRVVTPKGGKPMAMTYVTPEAKAFKEQCAWIASRGKGLSKPFDHRVSLHLKLYPQRPLDWERRTRKDPLFWDDDVRCIDLGNAEKVISDALQGIVFTDDRWIWRQTKERMEPDGEARCIVQITPLSVTSPQEALL